MKAKIAFAVVAYILIAIAVGGCTSRHTFLATFDPWATVCDLAYPGYDCATHLGSDGDDIGVTGGGLGWGGRGNETQIAVSEAFALTDGLDAEFDTNSFVNVLATRITRDLSTAGYDSDLELTGSTAVVGFHSVSTKGRLEINAHRAPGMVIVDFHGHETADK